MVLPLETAQRIVDGFAKYIGQNHTPQNSIEISHRIVGSENSFKINNISADELLFA